MNTMVLVKEGLLARCKVGNHDGYRCFYFFFFSGNKPEKYVVSLYKSI